MSENSLRDALGYRRFGAAPRVLVLDSSYYTIADLITGAGALGWQVRSLKTPSHGLASEQFVADLLAALCSHRPDFVLTVNHRGFDEKGALAGLLHEYKIPLASWFVDHPLPIIGGSAVHVTPSTQIFCVERTALPWLASLGFADPVHLPTAASFACAATKIDRGQATRLGAPLCLVGQSWWGIARGDAAPPIRAAAERLLALRVLHQGYVGGRLLGELQNLPLGLADPRDQVRAAYVALAEQSLRARVKLAQALLPLPLRVYGDAHWAALVPGLDLRPMVDSQRELPAIYAGSDISLSQSAAALPTAANLRTWDVPAAGGFLLGDAQEDVLAHFREGEEIALYRSPEEAADKARFYLQHPTRRAQIARRAQALVHAHHCYPHRLTKLYQVLRARFA